MSLLDSFKTKAAKAIPATPALQQEEATLSEPIVAAELQSQLAELNTQLEALTASKTSLEASVAEAIQAKADSETALAGSEAKLAEALVELATYKADTIKAQRTAQLASVLPEDEVGTMLETTSSLNDAQFSVIFGTLQAKAGKEKEAFKEVGFSGATAQEDTDPLDKAIAAKYKTTDKGNK